MFDHDREPPSIPGTMPHPIEPIDRLAPAVRPTRRPVMRQRWRELLFIHWRVDPRQLRPLVPDNLELDLFEGTAYVGLVAFTMKGVRPVGFPAFPGLSNFHETNVRTYVHRAGKDPGVWFFSLDAANSIAVRLARAWFHLPYHRCLMFLEREDPGQTAEPGTILYAGTRSWSGPVPASYMIRGEVTGSVEPARPGSVEHFLVERYMLYAQHRHRLYLASVHHTPYPLQSANVLSLHETLLAAAGIPVPTTPPLVHFAAEVDVEVFPLVPL
jgi:uncharacterized protein YqjF (DUF2071 family)